jgi:hypothetical protein
MRKIANTTELQTELRRILAYSRTERPSRRRLAATLSALSIRVAKVAPSDWTQKDGVWLVRSQYADGETHSWGITERGGKFIVEVNKPDGTFQCKKQFDELGKAQRYAAKFIGKADGASKLSDVLDKDFKEVNGGGKKFSPLNASIRLAGDDDDKGMWFPEMKHKALGLEMSQWAEGHDDVQVVCSNIISKRAIPKQKLLDAADRLERYVDDAKAGKHGWTKQDHKSLLKMIKQLRKEHDDVEDGD